MDTGASTSPTVSTTGTLLFIEDSPKNDELEDGKGSHREHRSTYQEWSPSIAHFLKNHFSNPILAKRDLSIYETQGLRALNFSFEAFDATFDLIADAMKKCDLGASTSWRLYMPLRSVVEAREISPSTPHVVVLNGMTPPPELELDFNKWYSEEHIMMLSRVPGWIYSKRYQLVASSNGGAPQYLAVHGWNSAASFQHELYKMAGSTPWRMSVINNVVARERYILDFVAGNEHSWET